MAICETFGKRYNNRLDAVPAGEAVGWTGGQ